MKAKVIFCVFVIVVVAISGVLCADDVIQGFTLTTLDGKTVDYRSLRGMPIVINFGAHW
jgi:hypothetical protein